MFLDGGLGVPSSPNCEPEAVDLRNRVKAEHRPFFFLAG